MVRPFLVVTMVAGVVLIGAGCAGRTASRLETGATSGTGSPTIEDAGRATYRGIYNRPIVLRNGRYEGPPFVPDGAARPTVELIRDVWRLVDLDADDVDEAVVLLAEHSGGSGVFLFVAVLAFRNDLVTNIATARVGDRVQIRRMRAQAGAVTLDLVQQGSGDAACCPSRIVRRTWVMRGGELVERDVEAEGTLSLDVLSGQQWVLSHIAGGGPAPTTPEVVLSFDANRVAGSSGCNRIEAPIDETSPGFLRVGEIATTRRTCPENVMTLESWFLARLPYATRYGFLNERLAITVQTGDGIETLLFEPRPPVSP